MKLFTDSLKKFCAPEPLFLLALIMIASPAQAQKDAVPQLPSAQIDPDLLDPSRPADRPLPNPLTVFEIEEKRKTVVRMPQNKDRTLKLGVSKNSAERPSNETAAPRPPRRPKTLNAPKSFIAQAREKELKRQDDKTQKKKPPVQPVAKAKKPAPPKIIEIRPEPAGKSSKQDALEDRLVQPSLLDILKTIDPKHGK